MLRYAAGLKCRARKLRKKPTESENALWSHVRGKQILGVQFYRQKPIGQYIVDFFAPHAGLVVEVDGSQHMEANHLETDKYRDTYLEGLGLKVLRFNSREVLNETDAVMEVIYRMITVRMDSEIPPVPPFFKGGIKSKPQKESVIMKKN
jgi:very-short-patch-repair endonuclease